MFVRRSHRQWEYTIDSVGPSVRAIGLQGWPLLLQRDNAATFTSNRWQNEVRWQTKPSNSFALSPCGFLSNYEHCRLIGLQIAAISIDIENPPASKALDFGNDLFPEVDPWSLQQ